MEKTRAYSSSKINLLENTLRRGQNINLSILISPNKLLIIKRVNFIPITFGVPNNRNGRFISCRQSPSFFLILFYCYLFSITNYSKDPFLVF